MSPEAVNVLTKIDSFAREVIADAKAVRLVSFNKTSEMKWALPWHQDRVIAVEDKIEVFGFENWSQKRGVWHCDPPIHILDKMIFARIHIDDSDETNGCLELALGSHLKGRVLSKDVEGLVANLPTEAFMAKRGDILFVKALTLHRSRSSNSILPRKVLRIDYSNQILPCPLSWNFR